jgi:transcription elongation factor Elf1
MTTNGTITMPTKKAAKRAPGFTPLPCPICGETAATITLDLTDLATCHCEQCGDDFAVSTAIKVLSERLEAWRAVARWIDMAGDVLAAPATE